MFERVLGWFRGENTSQEDLKMFFEQTTEMCFKECVSIPKYRSLFRNQKSLTEKEKECVRNCTQKKIKHFLEIENSIAKHFT